MNVKQGIYIEADDIATKYIDNLFNKCNLNSKYPVCPIFHVIQIIKTSDEINRCK